MQSYFGDLYFLLFLGFTVGVWWCHDYFDKGLSMLLVAVFFAVVAYCLDKHIRK